MFGKKKKIPKEKPLIGYKGFNENLTCFNGFLYEVGKEYECNGEIKACANGFHACKSPLNVFNYYPAIDSDNRFCRVAQWGVIDKNGDKTSSSNIKILEEISLRDMFEIASREIENTRFGEDSYLLKGDNSKLSTNECFKKIILDGICSTSFIKGKFNSIFEIGHGQKIVVLDSRNTVNIFGEHCSCFVFEPDNNIIINRDAFFDSYGGCHVLIFAERCNITVYGRGHVISVFGENNTIRVFNKDNDIFVKKDNTIIYVGIEEKIETLIDMTQYRKI